MNQRMRLSTVLASAWIIFGCSDEPAEETGSAGAAGMGASAGSGVTAGAGGAAPTSGAAGALPAGRAGSASAGSGNASGGDAGSSGGTGLGGGGAPSNGGMANAGRSGSTGLTPEAIRDQAQAQCVPFCELLLDACPEIPEDNCLTGCRTQAELLYEDGSCGGEWLEVYRCANSELTTADIECSGPELLGCLGEQAAFIACRDGE